MKERHGSGKGGMRGALAASLWLTASPALADAPPPDGTKYVSFEVRVDGLEAHPDHVLLVYPWSLSNGAPTDEIGEIPPGEGLRFGRRIMGAPKVYAMRKDAWTQLKESLADRDPRARDGDLLPVEGTIDCQLTIDPRHTVDDGGPDAAVDTFTVRALGDDTCRLQRLSSTPAPSPHGGCASCRVADDPDARPWWLIALGALVWRRRR